MKNFEEKIKSKMTAMPRLKGIKSRLSIKIVMWKFLRGGATLIPGATFIPESRVHTMIISECTNMLKPFKILFYKN